MGDSPDYKKDKRKRGMPDRRGPGPNGDRRRSNEPEGYGDNMPGRGPGPNGDRRRSYEPEGNGDNMPGRGPPDPSRYDQNMQQLGPIDPERYGQNMHGSGPQGYGYNNMAGYGQPGPPHPYGQNMNMQGPPVVSQKQETTVVIQQQPTVQNDKLVTAPAGHRDWSSGMFSCFDDVGKCCMTMFCQECVLMEIANRTGECCCVPLWLPGGLITLRARIRTLGGIRGSICNDYLALSCCYMCALCQMHRELDHMGL